MRIVLLALVTAAAWLVRRERSTGRPHVQVAWRDGAELDLGNRSPEHARLTRIAAEALG